jgi:hypothetical protein
VNSEMHSRYVRGIRSGPCPSFSRSIALALDRCAC